MVLIVAALAEELRHFSDQLEDTRLIREFPFPVLGGRIGNIGEVVLGIVGSGKVQSGIHTSALITRLSPSRLFAVGIAAGVSPVLSLGDIVQITDAVQYDLNIGRFGLKRGMINGTMPVYAEADVCDIDIPKVRCGTADIFLSPQYVKDNPWLTEELKVEIADMESYSMIGAAQEMGIPCMAFRVVSDTMSGERPKNFKQFMQDASQKLYETVCAAFSHAAE